MGGWNYAGAWQGNKGLADLLPNRCLEGVALEEVRHLGSHILSSLLGVPDSVGHLALHLVELILRTGRHCDGCSDGVLANINGSGSGLVAVNSIIHLWVIRVWSVCGVRGRRGSACTHVLFCLINEYRCE